MSNNDLQNMHITRVTRIPLKTEVNAGVSEGKAVPVPLKAPVVLI